MQNYTVLEGFLGSCECGFQTEDLPTKSMVREAMNVHFDRVLGPDWDLMELMPWMMGHSYERMG